MGKGIYEGVRVLELSDEKGMYCGKLLAEVGMEVIKIEPPQGDAMRLTAPFVNGEEDKEKSIFWLYHNTGKKSVTLDLETEGGRDTFRKLAKDADIIIETFTPGKMKEYGISYEELKEINPKLIMCSITAFGQDGPYAQWNSSSDMIPFAIAGNMYEAGLPGMKNEPLTLGRNICYNATGLYAAVGILAQLRQVQKTGEGCHIDAAAVETAGLWKNEAMANPQRFPYLIDRHKAGSNGPFPPSGLFKCKDGGVYLVGMALWGPLSDWCKEVGMDIGQFDEEKYKIPNNDNPDIIAHADEIIGLVNELCSHYTKDELYQEGLKRRIPIVPMNSPEEVCNDVHYAEREYFVEVDHPVAGKAMYPGAPAKLSRTPFTVNEPAPLLGADTDSILSVLGEKE
jgi:crotonobetainyl-CoA:carnitine CoA-transferase CaiB-like acyl-CoA transferase